MKGLKIMKFNKSIYSSIIIILSIILMKNDITRKYIVLLYIIVAVACIISISIDLLLVFNKPMKYFSCNRYLEKKAISVDNHISEIKNNKLDYVSKSEKGFLFIWALVLIIEVLFYKSNLNIFIISVTLIMIILSSYLLLSVYIYNEAGREKGIKILKINEKILYSINSSKLIILIITLGIMLVKIA